MIQSVLAGERKWAVVCADNKDVHAALPNKSVDHVITDPPYSAHVHSNARSGHKFQDERGYKCCHGRRKEFSFDHITEEEMAVVGVEFARISKRWTMAFSDLEIAHQWRERLEATGLQYIRTGLWVKIGGMPQFSGDRPSIGAEAITICHPKGRKRWNGGGSAAVWPHPIVANRLGSRGARVHDAQKPLGLMLDLVKLFTDPGDIILDPYCGSGTTLVAALRLGRRAIGIEKNPKHAATAIEACEAEERGSNLVAARAGQLSFFG